jgi:hypothetical protein
MSTWFSNIFGGGRDDKDYTPPKFESKYEPPNKDGEKKKEVNPNKSNQPTSVVVVKTQPQESTKQQNQQEEEEEDDMFQDMEVKIETKEEDQSRSNYVPPTTTTTTSNALSSPITPQNSQFQEEKPATSPISETITKKNSSSSLKE